MTDQTALSSFELLLQGKLQPASESKAPLRGGEICPGCGLGRLDYNGLLALECPQCGFSDLETGGCT